MAEGEGGEELTGVHPDEEGKGASPGETAKSKAGKKVCLSVGAEI